ncbi:exosporium protein G [Bacillus sp. XF8]|nr:exosporium protein G [Bacillus sp. XF8]MBO1583241.1 exosporium protein G [Bacillus sp. XF8]
MEITCILLENGQYFLVTKVGDLVTLKVPIPALIAQQLLAAGFPECS